MKALKENGSASLKFEMNPDRDYLSVTIPVHDYFLAGKSVSDKEAKYSEKILALLGKETLSLTELSDRMGYKGITAKLKRTVSELVEQGKIRQIAENGSVKYKA